MKNSEVTEILIWNAFHWKSGEHAQNKSAYKNCIKLDFTIMQCIEI